MKQVGFFFILNTNKDIIDPEVPLLFSFLKVSKNSLFIDFINKYSHKK